MSVQKKALYSCRLEAQDCFRFHKWNFLERSARFVNPTLPAGEVLFIHVNQTGSSVSAAIWIDLNMPLRLFSVCETNMPTHWPRGRQKRSQNASWFLARVQKWRFDFYWAIVSLNAICRLVSTQNMPACVGRNLSARSDSSVKVAYEHHFWKASVGWAHNET